MACVLLRQLCVARELWFAIPPAFQEIVKTNLIAWCGCFGTCFRCGNRLEDAVAVVFAACERIHPRKSAVVHAGSLRKFAPTFQRARAASRRGQKSFCRCVLKPSGPRERLTGSSGSFCYPKCWNSHQMRYIFQ
jgi:hypothetical protein